jgi:hypothetical protein
MKMNRRTFHSTLFLTAVGAGICSSPPAACAAAASAAATPSYRHRLRFRRQKGVYDFWIRVANTKSMSADVPFTLQFSTDAAGRNVIQTNAHVSQVRSSHLVRGRIDMSAAGWTEGTPLYARFLMGPEKTPMMVRKLVPLTFD